ncbi:MAG: response regulator transcription factor [Chlorobi bacterium]|nr:response regulator transcription factor [Chlorobiota bacterium]
MINLFVIDDHPIFIEGLKKIFDPKSDKIKISGCAHSASEAQPLLKRSKAKVVILDLVMPGLNGSDFCLVIKKQYPDKKVIALTGERDSEVIFNTWRNNADAILSKYCGKQELVETIHDVLKGETVAGSNIPSIKELTFKNSNSFNILTKTETQVLKLLAEGNSRENACNILGLKSNTIQFHCRNIFKKIKRNKLVSVIEEAKRLGILQV